MHTQEGCCGSKHRYFVLFYYYTKLNLTVEAITAKLNNQELYSKFNVIFGLLRLIVNPDIKQEETGYQELRYATYTRPKEKNVQIHSFREKMIGRSQDIIAKRAQKKRKVKIYLS